MILCDIIRLMFRYITYYNIYKTAFKLRNTVNGFLMSVSSIFVYGRRDLFLQNNVIFLKPTFTYNKINIGKNEKLYYVYV